VKDILWLRLFAMVSSLVIIPYYLPQTEPLHADYVELCVHQYSRHAAAAFTDDQQQDVLRCRPSNSTTSERVPPMLSNTSNRLGITVEELMAVTVTSKGQVTVPKQVRDRLGIKPGSKVDFEIAEDGRAFLRRVGKRTVKPSRFERMRGTATSGLTTDAIMALSRGESR
jgi:antitoxin PrlF